MMNASLTEERRGVQKVSLAAIVSYLNRELKVRRIPDSSRNGIQVRGSQEVRTIGFAVDACLETFERAKRLGVDLIIVHHGLLWKGERDSTGFRRRRIAYLKKHDISLYAVHLPLDLHPTLGNNAVLARLLSLERTEAFGRYKGILVGCRGRFRKPLALRSIARRLEEGLKTRCRVLRYGSPRVQTAGIVSGRGASMFADGVARRLPCFITGEVTHEACLLARDARMNVIVAGHYATETVGVRALMPLLQERFGVKTRFIDVPTGT